MPELAANLECLVCGRWWITAVGGSHSRNGATLCPGCHIDCANCGTPLTVNQLRLRRNAESTTPPACSRSCSGHLITPGAAA